MLASYGMYNPVGCLFHLITHAFFKASSFSAAGSIIHTINNEQDIRKMGGFLNYIPLTFSCMLVGFAGLVGLPFYSGYYSKDYILFYPHNHNPSLIIMISSSLIILSSFLTISYSIKILYRVFLVRNSLMFRERIDGIVDSGICMNLALIILTCSTLLCGYFIKELYLEQSFLFSTGFWGGIFSNYYAEPFFSHEIEFISIYYKLLFISILIIGFFSYLRSAGIKASFYIFNIKYLLSDFCIIYIKLIYKAVIFRAIYMLMIKIIYYISFKWFLELIDRGVLEKFGSLGIVETLDTLYIQIVSSHRNEGWFLGSLMNFWFIIYFSTLLYMKIICVSTLLASLISILIACSLIHYLEMFWKLIGLIYKKIN
jgi:NADH:ubiquinone oxidoreductase subunit 5 (subunit L)/multisubunit Na+/H+ antiporter MnhA subunit